MFKLVVLTISSLCLQHLFFVPLFNLLSGRPSRKRRVNLRPVELQKPEEVALADKDNETSSVKLEAEKKSDKYICVEIETMEDFEFLLKDSSFKREKPRFLAAN
mmetsp:Transcript_13262/g.20762  ORF Transcript_13262/g.20762 Transcript_13262/m.20762 type:complete len:104 (+) Transcript_13262:1237-1548(+)